MRGSLGQTDMVLAFKDGVYNIFLGKSVHKCHDAGVELFSKKENFERYISEFKAYVKRVKEHIIPKYSIVPEAMSKQELIEDVRFIGKFWYYYGITEFPYLDKAHAVMEKTKDQKMKERLDFLSKYKFKGRDILNAFFFKNGVLENLLKYITLKYDIDARFLFLDELFEIFDGKAFDKKLIKERSICYAASITDGKIQKHCLKEAIEVNKLLSHVEAKDEIKGMIVSPGKAKGRAIICPMLTDHDEIAKLDKRMKKGDILIAETTSPDVMVLVNKAAAIVAEQGGVLSHAAVVSRELGLPCIVQAKDAIKIFKDGDIVEVDAEKGIVKRV